MAKTQDLKRRIRSIRNTRQLTKAMKMVSAAKLRRAQDRIGAARPYAQKLREVLASLAAQAEGDAHPLLEQREGNRIELVVLTADRGLCGAFNGQVIREAMQFARSHRDKELVITAIGKKGREIFRKRGLTIRREELDAMRAVDYSLASDVGTELIQRYAADQVDRIYLLYNEAVTAISARPKLMQLLPAEPQAIESGSAGGGGGAAFRDEPIYEPGAQQLFDALLPHYVKNQVFQALLESVAGEHAMRMAAMDSATRNAGELIDKLTLTMNRVRQASITTEIIEVVSGAEALG